MIKSFFLLVLALIPQGICLFSQSLIGIWKGELYQEPQKTFYFEIRVQKIQGNRIYGVTYIQNGGNAMQFGSKKGDYGTLEFGGVWNGEDVIIQETGIVQQEKSSSFYWCIKKCMLKLSKTDNEWTLSGAWYSTGGCMPGVLTVKKKVKTPKKDEQVNPEPNDSLANIEPLHSVHPEDTITESHKANNDSTGHRPVNIKYDVVVVNPKIELKIWDNNLVDGDIISLSLNGNWVLKEHTVTKGKKKLFLQLTEKENVLVLFAENLGKVPPNTAAIIVDDGQNEQKIILNSDKGKSEAIKINLQ
jgi:hypothetical protein